MTKIEVQSVSDEIAESIRTIAEAAEAMRGSGLTQRAIVLLLHDMSKVSITDINYVLNCLDSLAETYLVRK